MVEVDLLLPRAQRITDETLRAYEVGQAPARGIDPVVLAAIAVALDLDLDALDPSARDDLATIARLAERALTGAPATIARYPMPEAA